MAASRLTQEDWSVASSTNHSWSATLGGIVGGLIPGVGLVADIRDLGAAVSHVADGKEGAWFELGASIVGFVPGGDIAKGIAKGVTKGATKTATKIGAEVADDVARVIKGSTATAADGLSGAQKGAAASRRATGSGCLFGDRFRCSGRGALQATANGKLGGFSGLRQGV